MSIQIKSKLRFTVAASACGVPKRSAGGGRSGLPALGHHEGPGILVARLDVSSTLALDASRTSSSISCKPVTPVR